MPDNSGVSLIQYRRTRSRVLSTPAKSFFARTCTCTFYAVYGSVYYAAVKSFQIFCVVYSGFTVNIFHVSDFFTNYLLRSFDVPHSRNRITKITSTNNIQSNPNPNLIKRHFPPSNSTWFMNSKLITVQYENNLGKNLPQLTLFFYCIYNFSQDTRL